MSIKIAVFVSGRGSNLNAIIQAVEDGDLDAEIVRVISNDPEAQALTIAAQHGIETFALSHKGLKRREHEEKVLEHLKDLSIDYIVLAGYMRVLSSHFLKAFKHKDGYFRVINIHPSLLPAFPGINGYEEAFNYGVKVSGVTVHLVDEKVDHGPILAQVPFPRFAEDTLDSFCARGLSVEHSLYPSVLRQIAESGIEDLNLIKPEQRNREKTVKK
ncbi:MAG: phosphoribosylglycinamide formyltransferase [Candidatus Obscuribacterales bacterium]|nr:phosphoribosylglycinamide formyltransferase [Candidatus Obscuribacterales bacterium]